MNLFTFFIFSFNIFERSKEYFWCLTYEQPLEKKNTQNRKYRVLLASKELMEYALKKEPYEVFNKKGIADGAYTRYCDRRWFHLRTMGQIVKAKQELELTKGKWSLISFVFVYQTICMSCIYCQSYT